MEQLKSQAIDFYNNNKKAVIAIGSLAVLASLKIYFKGGVCRADRDLEKKVIVITGGNSGIGKATVEALSRKGCTTIIGARDKAKADELIEMIRHKNPDCQLLFFPLDLADKESIKEFSQNIHDVADCINVLINNAGLILPNRRQTKDGFEMTMGVNHLGHFYLTHLLWDLVKAADKPRVINVSSIAHLGTGFNRSMNYIDFDDINMLKQYTTRNAYARSKMANVLFTRMLQAKMDEANIKGFSYSLHPGVIFSEMGRHFGAIYPILKVLLLPISLIFTKTEWEGAQTTLFLVLEDEARLQKGQYYKDCQVKKSSDFTSSMENAQRLWKLSEDMLGIKFDV